MATQPTLPVGVFVRVTWWYACRQASMNPHRVLVQHMRDEKYSATDDVIKARCGQQSSAT